MNIKDALINLFRSPESKVITTPYGRFNLASPRDRKRLSNLAIQLQLTTDALTRKDIADWRQAWQLAINQDYPNRQRLLDIYRDVDVDLHLSGCVEQRMGFVMAKSFHLTDSEGADIDEATHLLDQAWFKQLLRYALEARYWGHSLIELGDTVTDGDGCPSIAEVTLIPRKHVIPEKGRVIRTLSETWNSGIAYREQPYIDNLIEVGQPLDLGLYLKAATQTIPKKNMMGFWDTFGEIFGMPIRIARTASRDPKELERLGTMLDLMANNQRIVASQDTEIEFIESAKSDAFNVYDRRIDRANSELSKLIIGQTMTIEDGSSLSQSQTHLEVFRNLVDADADLIRDMVNNQLLPKLIKRGFPLDGLTFNWDETIDWTPEQQIAIEQMLLGRYAIDPKYFENKYGVVITGEQAPTLMAAPNKGIHSIDPKFFENKYGVVITGEQAPTLMAAPNKGKQDFFD